MRMAHLLTSCVAVITGLGSPEYPEQLKIYGPTSRYIGGAPNRNKYIPAGPRKNVTNTMAGVSDGNITRQHNAWSMNKFGEIR